ncbi:hypothetical protein SAY87_022428 [Trapa incisa]|uniref:Uncharacterized protein n=1 Tax=Trapa incisa TaxID=236973 RepID=A0AAN7K486_9MYRT|nr:hypothetical protein SAY87_022428 [Trapa incisa]
MNVSSAFCHMLNLPISGKQYFRFCRFPSIRSSVMITNANSLLLTRPLATETATERHVFSSATVREAEKVEKEASTELGSLAPRRLILLRHAKSSWADRSLRDHDRPLSKSGRADAIKISHKFKELGWIPELILLSDAVRTRETLQIMQEQVKSFLEAEIYLISSFYSIAAMDGQTAEHLQKAICKYSRDEIGTVMCMGHNKGWEEAASMFSGASVELKTSNAALLEARGRTWEEAFAFAGLGGWKLQCIVKPIS